MAVNNEKPSFRSVFHYNAWQQSDSAPAGDEKGTKKNL